MGSVLVMKHPDEVALVGFYPGLLPDTLSISSLVAMTAELAEAT